MAPERSARVGANLAPIPVVAGLLFRGGKVLLCQRHEGPHLALMWEFPGGKIDTGESPQEALQRELNEELGVVASVGYRVDAVVHAYPEKRVWIRFYRVQFCGHPRPLVHRQICWVEPVELDRYAVPPPNQPIVDRLRKGELAIH